MKEPSWKDFETFEILMAGKMYTELSVSELKLVNQFVDSEQEYEALRLSGIEMKRWFIQNAPATADDNILSDLKRELKRSHKPVIPVWNVSVGYAMAAVIFGLCGWWLGQSQKPMPVHSVERVLVHDTVFVAMRPDTVFRERIIYRDRPLVLTSQPTPLEIKSPKGISMKEKEELDNLLVSGTR